MLTPSTPTPPSARPVVGGAAAAAATPSRWQRLTSLPRDVRDTLFLLGLIGWVVALLSPNLPAWCWGGAALVLAWRGWLTWEGRPLPGRWWRVGLLLLAVVATVLTYRTIFGRDAGVTLIVGLLALKTLELRARRDAFVVFFLALFTLLTQFSYSQSLLTAAGVLVAVWGLLTSLVNAHMPHGRPPLWQAARTAGTLALLGAPIMVALFLLFPRIGPLWGLPADALKGRTGLSDSLSVGQVAELAQDGSVAMRLRFEGPVPPNAQLYFRGPVLGQFDGRTWTPTPTPMTPELQPQAELRVRGPAVAYEVTLEPHRQNWLLTLDAAERPPQLGRRTAVMTPQLQWMTRRPVTELVRYRAESHLDFSHGPVADDLSLQAERELPAGFNPRTLMLAQTWANDDRRAHPQTARDDPARTLRLVDRALNLLRTGGYAYTLQPGAYGRDAVDEFLFDRKLGFCEHMATAFVVLMRGLDIPARIVTGYQGGERNPLDGYWTVRQSDAHAWTEVWVPGTGWQRVDPTAVVAPSRTATLQRLQAPQGAVATAMVQLNPALLAQLRATWEAANNRWNQWVLNYTQDRQFELLGKLGFQSPSWTDLGAVVAGLIATVGLLGAAWSWWDRQQHDPWLRLLAQARHRALRAQPGSVTDQATPRQLAAALGALTPPGQVPIAQAPLAPPPDPHRQAWLDWLADLERWRYAPTNATAAEQRQALLRLRQRLQRLRWPTDTPPPNAPHSPS